MFNANLMNEKMYLIVGLGNPEPEYSKTRHNVGFDAVNLISQKYNIPFDKKGFDGIYGIGEIDGKKVILLKPQTYMNESGKSIIQVKNFYKIPIENIIIIHDEMDFDVGNVKLRKQGGAGTHNGMKSVVNELKSKNFPRVRIGTGMPIFKDLMIDYVIKRLTDEEYEKLKEPIKTASEAAVSIVKDGIDLSMNKYN